LVHLCAIVAKIFYCGGPSGRLGVLRAAMPFSDLKPLMSGESRDYVGSSCPELSHNTSAHTVIEIVQEQENVTWKAGFYLFEKTPLHFEDCLQTFCKVTNGSI